MMRLPIRYAAALCGFALPALAQAQMTLERPEAPVGTFYKAVLRVTRGCAGSATVKVRARMPEGFIDVRAMPKPGWLLDTVKGKYAQTYELARSKAAEGVKEITWAGGRLPDDQYDEFVFAGMIAKSLKIGAILYFPVTQECETGAERWIELPAPGKPAFQLKSPAPALTLTIGDLK